MEIYLVFAESPLQVHADATRFEDNSSKAEIHARVLFEAESLLDGQRNWVISSCLPPGVVLLMIFAGLVSKAIHAFQDPVSLHLL